MGKATTPTPYATHDSLVPNGWPGVHGGLCVVADGGGGEREKRQSHETAASCSYVSVLLLVVCWLGFGWSLDGGGGG